MRLLLAAPIFMLLFLGCKIQPGRYQVTSAEYTMSGIAGDYEHHSILKIDTYTGKVWEFHPNTYLVSDIDPWTELTFIPEKKTK
jgi:hypothetical protein